METKTIKKSNTFSAKALVMEEPTLNESKNGTKYVRFQVSQEINGNLTVFTAVSYNTVASKTVRKYELKKGDLVDFKDAYFEINPVFEDKKKIDETVSFVYGDLSLLEDEETKTCNGAILLGTVVNEPKLIEREGKQPLAIFPVGFQNRKYTNYIDVSVVGNYAKTLKEYLRKGSKVQITGELVRNHYEGKDGELVNKFRMLASEALWKDVPEAIEHKMV